MISFRGVFYHLFEGQKTQLPQSEQLNMPSSTLVAYSGILYFKVTFGLQILGGTLINQILGLLNKF